MPVAGQIKAVNPITAPLPMALLLGCVLLFAFVVKELAVEWNVSTQYSYGWAIPFLCAYLFFLRWKDSPNPAAISARSRAVTIGVMIAALALLLPIRLVQEASPDYRVTAWGASLVFVSFTIGVLFLTGGSAYLRHFGFVPLFFLVSVPWLRPLEDVVVNNLTRLNVACTLDIVTALGIPALQHGNTIEIATGTVGVDEACSGIRSFQATLMVSLFFGELYRLTVARRVLCVFAGFALSFLFNIVRTSLLTWVAAEKGLSAIHGWHDPAGVTILVGCFIGLYAVALWLRKGMPQSTAAAAKEGPQIPKTSAHSHRLLGIACCLWIVAVEGTTELWYRSHERGRSPSVSWSMQPPDRSDIRSIPISPDVRSNLRYSDGLKCAWQNGDGSKWTFMYFNWEPGRTWVKQVTRHAPEGCLSGAGWRLVEDHGIKTVSTTQFPLGFRCYTFRAAEVTAYVFYALWEEGARVQPEFSRKLASHDRIRSALEGRRNPGMKVVEFALEGFPNHNEAFEALQRELPRLMVVR